LCCVVSWEYEMKTFGADMRSLGDCRQYPL
jgi:hypothetical protein